VETYDLGGRDADSVEKQGLPAGWYIAMVDKVRKDEKSSALLVRFVVKAGDHEGAEITERLWGPRGDDREKDKKAIDRRIMIAKRLGMIPENAWGANAKVDWEEATGRVCAIQVKKTARKDDAGNVTEYTNVDYGGVYPVDDQRVPEEVRKLAVGIEGGAPANGGRDAFPEL
jgi:hypothetical protein